MCVKLDDKQPQISSVDNFHELYLLVLFARLHTRTSHGFAQYNHNLYGSKCFLLEKREYYDKSFKYIYVNWNMIIISNFSCHFRWTSVYRMRMIIDQSSPPLWPCCRCRRLRVSAARSTQYTLRIATLGLTAESDISSLKILSKYSRSTLLLENLVYRWVCQPYYWRT